MHNQRTTGLTAELFPTLTTALQKNLTWNKPTIRPRKLSLNQALKIILLYLPHNLTEELLADIFETSQATISSTIHRIESALLQLPELKTAGLESLSKVPDSLVVDGTMIAVWNWATQGKILFSGKHHRAGFNHQVSCTLHGK